MAKKILITSALPYVNNTPHLGNIIGCVLPADVYNRYCKRMGRETLFICGADEYGSCTLVKAEEEGLTPREICNKYITVHQEIYKWFNIDFDYFGRTSTNDPQEDINWNHTIISQNIFKKFVENDYVFEQDLLQLYCRELDITIADRFVVGTCPRCKYQKAKGDQCDSCGGLHDAVDLINPIYKFNENYKLEKKNVSHLFLDLPKLETYLKKWYESVKENWAENAVHITDAWFKEGLKERCITRDIKWGTPIPDTDKFGDKYKDKVLYNWIDACYGYLSITAEHTSDWKEWWLNPENVKLVQMFSSDNVPFHTILFPATLIATCDNYTKVNTVASCEYLTYDGRKFSKSENVGVFGDSAMKSEIESDIWRYYLLYIRPENKTADFNWKDLYAKVNGELVENLSNMINRVLQFTYKNGGVIYKIDDSILTLEDRQFIETINNYAVDYKNYLDNIKLKKGLYTILDISHEVNKYFQLTKPWKLIKEDKNRCNNLLSVFVHIVGLIGNILYPYMPDTSKKIFDMINIDYPCFKLSFDLFPENHQINEPFILFYKMDENLIEEYIKLYG